MIVDIVSAKEKISSTDIPRHKIIETCYKMYNQFLDKLKKIFY